MCGERGKRIGLSRGKNWAAVKLQQKPQLIFWGDLWIWDGPSELSELKWGGWASDAPLLTKTYHWMWAALGPGTQNCMRLFPLAKGSSRGRASLSTISKQSSQTWWQRWGNNLSPEGAGGERNLGGREIAITSSNAVLKISWDHECRRALNLFNTL